jgi:hypothetical protein
LPGQDQKAICNQSVKPDLAESADSGNRVRFWRVGSGTGSGTWPHAAALLESALQRLQRGLNQSGVGRNQKANPIIEILDVCVCGPPPAGASR